MRFRDEHGHLTVSVRELAELTKEEGVAYYKEGERYWFQCDECEYLCEGTHGDTGELLYFKRKDGGELGVPVKACGTFLPDVASEGMALVRMNE